MLRLCTTWDHAQDAQFVSTPGNTLPPPPPLADILLQCEFKHLPLARVVSILSGNHMGEVLFVMRLEQFA